MPMIARPMSGRRGDVALFSSAFPGTRGKTTLSADPFRRTLDRDDEQRGGPRGRVSIRGRLLRQGAFKLSAEAEPEILRHHARFGNRAGKKRGVSIPDTRICDFDERDQTRTPARLCPRFHPFRNPSSRQSREIAHSATRSGSISRPRFKSVSSRRDIFAADRRPPSACFNGSRTQILSKLRRLGDVHASLRVSEQYYLRKLLQPDALAPLA